jgi:hypothetical protein
MNMTCPDKSPSARAISAIRAMKGEGDCFAKDLRSWSQSLLHFFNCYRAFTGTPILIASTSVKSSYTEGHVCGSFVVATAAYCTPALVRGSH